MIAANIRNEIDRTKTLLSNLMINEIRIEKEVEFKITQISTRARMNNFKRADMT